MPSAIVVARHAASLSNDDSARIQKRNTGVASALRDGAYEDAVSITADAKVVYFTTQSTGTVTGIVR